VQFIIRVNLWRLCHDQAIPLQGRLMIGSHRVNTFQIKYAQRTNTSALRTSDTGRNAPLPFVLVQLIWSIKFICNRDLWPYITAQ
jgi:hypothetical protein